MADNKPEGKIDYVANNAKIAVLEAEAKAIKQKKAQLVKQIKTGVKKAQALVDYAEQELKRAGAEPNPERAARLTRLGQLRLKGAKNNLESLALVQQIDPDGAPPAGIAVTLELLALKSNFILTEFNYTNYEPIMDILGEALNFKKAAPATEAPAETQKASTGPLGRPGMPPRPTLPTRPPAPRVPGLPTGTLPRPAVPGAGATGPLQAAAGARAMPPRPAVPGVPRPGGPQPPRPGMPRPGLGRPGSGPLQAPESSLDPNLLEEIKAAVADPAVRDKFKDLYIRVRDLETSLQPLRGEEPGEICISLEDAAPMIRQIAGKVYYINRSVATIGGELGDKVSFVGTGPDPVVEQLLGSMPDEDPNAPSAAAGAGGAGAAGGNQPVQLASRLRSLFNK